MAATRRPGTLVALAILLLLLRIAYDVVIEVAPAIGRNFVLAAALCGVFVATCANLDDSTSRWSTRGPKLSVRGRRHSSADKFRRAVGTPAQVL
eukprot:CAMPEP_0170269088 /NCGR_PEP_ID=MMETSP0116_2-20130129/34477_1 /TAXON_ID=400756 /ORGANISM="Durinskia baltica, Strain CSIRO CS-38" /LENGTH=93 /DNA_ID=CAMNT_0010520257 /DNA_START=26 /DNA_END=307 /DNA_ORIENTATION=-